MAHVLGPLLPSDGERGGGGWGGGSDWGPPSVGGPGPPDSGVGAALQITVGVSQAAPYHGATRYCAPTASARPHRPTTSASFEQ